MVGRKGQKAWNKGLTAETSLAVKKYTDKRRKKIKVNCSFCQNEIEKIPFHLKRNIKNYCNNKCAGKGSKGQHHSPATEFKVGHQNPTYNKGKGFIDNQGYKAFKINHKKVLEHRLIYMLHNGLENIPDGHDIHHIDENKLNNHPDNLVLLSKSDHAKLHWKMRRDEKINRFDEMGGVEFQY